MCWNCGNRLCGGCNGNWSPFAPGGLGPVAPGGVSAGAAQQSQAYLSALAQQNAAAAYYGAIYGGIGGPGLPCFPPTKAEPLPSDGFRVGELVGYRIWRVDSGYLRSFSYSIAWFPGEPMEGKPSDYGYEGIWAFKSRHHALQKMLDTPGSVMGSVWLWGDYVEHENGWRAQYAEVRGIYVYNEPNRIRYGWRRKRKVLHDLRVRYGVAEVS